MSLPLQMLSKSAPLFHETTVETRDFECDNCGLKSDDLAIVGDLRSEVGRLKAALTAANDECWQRANEMPKLALTNTMLRAELEKRQMTLDEATKPLHVEIERLAAEVDRLTRELEQMRQSKERTND